MRTEAALELGVQALAELGQELLDVEGTRPRAVAQLDRATQTQQRPALCKWLPQQLGGGGAIVTECNCVTCQLAVPARERRA